MKATWRNLACVVAMSVLLAGLSWSAPAAAAAAKAAPESAEQNPTLWKPRVTSVSVFKNGMGFFMREGEVALRDGWCLSREVPPAAFGTLAIYSHNADEVVDMVGSGPGEVVEFDGVDAAKDEAVKRARLEAALHLRLQLTYAQKGADRTAAGELVSVGAQFAVLETEANTFAVPVEGIKRMQMLELPIRAHVVGKGEKSPAKTRLGMAYLRKGVTWIPEYTLKILDDETAELSLRGTLVNEAEDLIHCDVNFVVGVPHFTHSDHLAPLAVGQVIRTIGAAVAPAGIQTQMMNGSALVGNNLVANPFGPGVAERPVAAAGRDVKDALGNLPQIEGAAASDYTVYTKKDMTLRCGEKAIVTLFTKKVKFTHVYRWSAPQGQVEHALSILNDTDTAWTTGPCLAISAGGPLGEDLLKYTPKNSRGEFPVTAAINVAKDHSEKEINRQRHAYEMSKDFWTDLVTLEGQLKVRNLETRPIDLDIVTAVNGKTLRASDDGAFSDDTSRLELLQRSSTVRHRLHLAVGETKTVTYQYEKYISSK
jgi:hypothetical protein